MLMYYIKINYNEFSLKIFYYLEPLERIQLKKIDILVNIMKKNYSSLLYLDLFD